MPSELDRVYPSNRSAELFGSHRLDVFADSPSVGLVGLVCQVTVTGRRAEYLAVVLDRSRQVVVHETGIVAPRQGWEIRSSGLWCEQTCEMPMQHWSYGLEAFGLDLDDPKSLLGRAVGDRVPIGWELEFEATGDATWSATGSSGTGSAGTGMGETGPTAPSPVGYQQRGRAHGMLLDLTGSHELSGTAIRSHWWAGEGPDRVEVGEGRLETGLGMAEIWVPADGHPWPTMVEMAAEQGTLPV